MDGFYGPAQPSLLERDRELMYGPTSHQANADGSTLTRVWVGNKDGVGEMVTFTYQRSHEPFSPSAVNDAAKLDLYSCRSAIQRHYSGLATDIICGLLFDAYLGRMAGKSMTFDEALEHVHD